MTLLRRLMILSLAGIGLLSATAPPVSASSVTITNLNCVDRGNGLMRCLGAASGGTGIYTYTWMPAPSSGSGSSVSIACYAYGPNDVTLTVTDSSGASDMLTKTFYCY